MESLPITAAQASPAAGVRPALTGVRQIGGDVRFSAVGDHGALVMVDERSNDLDTTIAVDVEASLHFHEKRRGAVAVGGAGVQSHRDLPDLKWRSRERDLEKKRIPAADKAHVHTGQPDAPHAREWCVVVLGHSPCSLDLARCRRMAVVNK